MNMKRLISLSLLMALLLLWAAPCDAQRRGNRRGRVQQQQQQAPPENPRFVQMLSAVQQIVFIDSMVVSADDFMRHIPLDPECGRLEQHKGLAGRFTNGLADRRFSAIIGTDSLSQLRASSLLADGWEEPQTLPGIDNTQAAYPYVMPDGVTLYFAQKDEGSLGGYDLYVSRYEWSKGTFLHPENMGLPFNSEADDLCLAIDEFNQLGYLVSNRRQPKGKVCIYVFVPAQNRRVYPSETTQDNHLRSLARIERIADTWNLISQQERSNAMSILKKMKAMHQ